MTVEESEAVDNLLGKWCARRSIHQYFCSRKPGHAGQHVAATVEGKPRILGTWFDMDAELQAFHASTAGAR